MPNKPEVELGGDWIGDKEARRLFRGGGFEGQTEQKGLERANVGVAESGL